LNGFATIIDSIILIGIMILIGFFCQKTKYVKDIDEKTSKIIKNITLPLLIITSLKTQPLNRELVKSAAFIIVFAFVSILLLLIIGVFTAKLFRLKGPEKKLHICLSAFGNVIFLAYPLVTSLFGQRGLMYAVFYALINDLWVWTFGVYMLSGKGKLKELINPNTISFLTGLFLMITNIDLPPVVMEAATRIGSATTPLSMLFIGCTLAKIDVLDIFKKASIYVLGAIKMIIMPILVVYIIFITGVSKYMPYEAVQVLALQVAMPAQTIFAILAKEYEVDPKYAAQTIFITTVLSMFTLPLVYRLIDFFKA